MSGISGISSNSTMAMAGMGGMHRRHRPDTEQMASELFSKLDTSGQGYLQKSDLQSALSGTSSDSSSGTSSVDDLFSALDTDSDGKVTKQEFTDTLKKLQEQLDQQFQDGRMQQAMQAGGMGGMPPPPRGGDDAGFSKDELQSQLNEIGSSDSQRSSLISNVIQNFDQADTDGDGKVSFKEAMALKDSQSGTASSSPSTTADSSSSQSASASGDAQVMQQIMKLMHAYLGHQHGNESASVSVSA